MREFGSPFSQAIERATAKIERVMPVELRHYTDALRSSTIFDNINLATYGASSEAIIAFNLAAYKGKCLTITYVSAEGETTERMIAPYGLILHARKWYVAGYCYLREDVRIFRLDRVRAFTQTEFVFTKPADFDALQFVLDSLARMPGTYAFEIIIHAPLATVQEYIPADIAVLKSERKDTLMRCYSDDPHWLARYLSRLEMPFTVRETDELRDALRDLAAEILASVG
jgi:predicted DNA-binding transcriptional regulator YafY